MRRLIGLSCEGETLAATLDEGAGTIGLLIVSGGNEVRAGAHRGMALLAARLATDGIPVLRFDRRGVGDSSGENRGYRASASDIAAAAAALREAGAARIVGFGNCDAASALALFGRAAGLDTLILANPWVADGGELPPPAAIRARYLARLRDPASWLRGFSLPKLVMGLRRLLAARSEQPDVLTALAAWRDDATVILAERDATAVAYADAARRAGLPPATVVVSTDAHSFARPGDLAPVEQAIREAIRRLR